MPAKSGKQFRFMEGIAHGMKPLKSAGGPSAAVAKEFVDKTPETKRKKFSHALMKKKSLNSGKSAEWQMAAGLIKDIYD